MFIAALAVSLSINVLQMENIDFTEFLLLKIKQF